MKTISTAYCILFKLIGTGCFFGGGLFAFSSLEISALNLQIATIFTGAIFTSIGILILLIDLNSP